MATKGNKIGIGDVDLTWVGKCREGKLRNGLHYQMLGFLLSMNCVDLEVWFHYPSASKNKNPKGCKHTIEPSAVLVLYGV